MRWSGRKDPQEYLRRLAKFHRSIRSATEYGLEGAAVTAPKPAVVIYTDGACSGNPGPGGWGAILIAGDGTAKELSRRRGGRRPTTAWS